VYAENEFFLTLAHPAGWTTHKPGAIALRQYPGTKRAPGAAFACMETVYSVAAAGAGRDAFLTHVRGRMRRVVRGHDKPYAIFDNFGAWDLGLTGQNNAERYVLHSLARLAEFKKATGASFDLFSIDFWPDSTGDLIRFDPKRFLQALDRENQDVFLMLYWGYRSPWWLQYGDTLFESGQPIEGSDPADFPTLRQRDSITQQLDQALLRARPDCFGNPRFILGDAREYGPYGYCCTDGRRAFLAINNSSWEERELKLELNRVWGLPDGGKWNVYRWYPQPARLTSEAVASFGPQVALALRPFEIVLLEVVPADQAPTLERKFADERIRSTAETIPQVAGFRVDLENRKAPDSRPGKGPGRAENGNFTLTEIRVKSLPAGKPHEVLPVRLCKPMASFEQMTWGAWPAAAALDGNKGTGWGIDPEEGHAHEAVFQFREPLDVAGAGTLVVELDQKERAHSLGRFRLSATTAAPVPEPPPSGKGKSPIFVRGKLPAAPTGGWLVVALQLERDGRPLRTQDLLSSVSAYGILNGLPAAFEAVLRGGPRGVSWQAWRCPLPANTSAQSFELRVKSSVHDRKALRFSAHFVPRQ
jgi:hypothetical protein